MTSLHYVVVPSLHAPPLAIAGRLKVPEGGGPAPAVIVLHGSAGPSEREGGYAEGLNRLGIVTLELDQWSARGLAGGAAGRPRTVHETLPDLYGARAWLAAHPKVDAARLGVIGFSFGGVAAMLAATRKANAPFLGDERFAAIMAVYPICHLYNRLPGFEFADLVEAPLLIVTGALDGYDDDPEAGPKLAASLAPAERERVRTEVIAGAHHGFDLPGADWIVEDPASHRGAGGKVAMTYDAAAAARAHGLAADFFSATLQAG